MKTLPSAIITTQVWRIEEAWSHPFTVIDRALVSGLCLLLILGVLAFGAVEDWSIFALEVGALALFLTWALIGPLSYNVSISRNPLYAPAFLFFLLIVAQLLFRQSAYPYLTRYECLQYVSYGILLTIAGECVRTKESRKVFAMSMTAFGGSYALFALVQDLMSNTKIFWIRTVRFHGAIYGSYVNRNHYAGLMEMLVPIPLVLSMSHLLEGGKRILVGFCGVLMASTIFLCGSRGGMIAFALQMILLGALISGKKLRLPAIGVYAVVCVSTLAFVFVSNNGRGLSRIGDLSPGIRPQITIDSMKMFAERPIWGWGLGTFPAVYPKYRSFYTNLFVNEAHNDYVQLLVETGVLGFGLMLWFLNHLYRRGLSTLEHWQRRWDGAVSLAALIGCTGILVHSFVEFNLQIPANAAIFYVLCALAATELDKHKTP